MNFPSPCKGKPNMGWDLDRPFRAQEHWTFIPGALPPATMVQAVGLNVPRLIGTAIATEEPRGTQMKNYLETPYVVSYGSWNYSRCRGENKSLKCLLSRRASGLNQGSSPQK